VVYSGFSLDKFVQDYGIFRGQLRQVYTGFWYIQGSVLDRFILDSSLFRVQFRQVYAGFWFIQG